MAIAITGYAQSVKDPATSYTPVHKYDPMRDGEQDLRDAIQEAKRTNKRVLVEVGGQWCSWCHALDRYFEEHQNLYALREAHFVMVKINFSEENPNKSLLSRYPPIYGYPHLFVLDKNGKLLRSQETGSLKEGKGYNLERFTSFLKQWAEPLQAKSK